MLQQLLQVFQGMSAHSVVLCNKWFSHFRISYWKCITPFQANAPKPAFTCSEFTIETLELGVKYVQS